VTCREQLAVGAYTLGTLEPDDRARVAEHLTTCAECRAAADDFASLPAMLDRVDPRNSGAAAPAPSESAFQRLAEAAARQRRQRKLQWLNVAAVLIVLVAALVVIGIAGGHGRHDTTAMVAVSGPVHASATLEPLSTGSRLTLRLSGVAAEERCRLVAIADDGRREVTASWKATYEGMATISGTTGIPTESLDSLVVETLDGRQLVRLTPRS
jgi:predicted anti-sigma-YlaC factor YlaD